VIWTEAHARGHSLVQIVRWMCEGPARLAGFTGRKGTIAAGADADLVVFDDAGTTTITAATIHHRHKVTPYSGETLRGAVHATYLRGQRIAEAGKAIATELGALL
jgi:allantoinase